MSKRKPTVCEACGFDSWSGRVCRSCTAYWGGPVANVLAAVALRRRIEGATYEQVPAIMGELCDVIVPDMFLRDLPVLVHQLPASAATIPAADAPERSVKDV